MVFSLFKVHWVMSNDVVELLTSWLSMFNKCKSMVFWSMIAHYLMWGIRQERNALTFEGSEGDS